MDMMTLLNSKASAEERRYRELLARSADGSLNAFSDLYELLYNPLVRFIYRYTQSDAIIEEILNDTLLVVWQKAASFRGDSRVITWVMGIARRLAMKTISREQAWSQPREKAWSDSPDTSETSRLVVCEALQWALAQLNCEQCAAIELAYFHGLSCEEIAQIQQCPVSTAKTRLHYGRQRLRAVFSDQCYALNFNDLMQELSP
jgi:RNA polymerase sigma-70 factor (ECF subfamily)